MNTFMPRLALWLVPLAAIALVAGLTVGHQELAKVAALAGLASLAIGLRSLSSLKSLAFTAWILVAVAAGGK